MYTLLSVLPRQGASCLCEHDLGYTAPIVCCGMGRMPGSEKTEQPPTSPLRLLRAQEKEEEVFPPFHTLSSLFVHFFFPSSSPSSSHSLLGKLYLSFLASWSASSPYKSLSSCRHHSVSTGIRVPHWFRATASLGCYFSNWVCL